MVRIVFFLVGLTTFVVAIAVSGPLTFFIDLPSIVVVVCPALFLSIAFHGGGAFFAAIEAGMTGACLGEAGFRQHRHVLQTLRNLLCASGSLGFLIGFILMLQNLDDPSRIGPGMAVALLTTFYAIFLAELLVAPMIHRLAACRTVAPGLAGDSSNPPSGGASSSARGLLTLLIALSGNSGLMLVVFATIN